MAALGIILLLLVFLLLFVLILRDFSRSQSEKKGTKK